ncbi:MULTISPECIES: DUF2637 domain-containing protein [unclassified Brevibacterium]|uniref:DUF2637 domain-containing protein n=1 Tax=Micrococcales TaxID=85006 RepID=UPI00196A6EDD|nr:DUF2637 domain-containing protein [Brevibacterium sp. S111]
MNALWGRRWAVVAAASGTVLIGGGAFWLSFVALADLAVRSGIDAGQAWIWPLLVDGLIVVATVAVVALDRHRSAWYPWALLIAGALVSVTANAAHAIVAATASVPGLLAATVAAVPPLVLLASTHLTVVLTRSTKPPEASTPLADALARAPRPALTEEMSASLVAQVDPVRPPELPERVAPAGTEPETPQPQPQPQDEPALTPTPEPSEPVGAGPGRRERAEALREAGWSNKAIARELGVHASTVGRWFPRTPGPETTKEEDKEKESDHEPQRV